MKKLTYLILAVSLIAGCTQNRSDESISSSQDHQIQAVLWFQKSAEMRALSYQSYNLAKLMLDKNIIEMSGELKPAVVLDLDETVLDNSPNQGNLVFTGTEHSKEGWKEWTDMAKAELLPGAKAFLEYAQSLGVEIFYVSNRDSSASFETTLANLQLLDLPSADAYHLRLKTNASSKEPRRLTIGSEFEIILMLGDNLADFEEVFEKRGDDLGFGDTDKRADLFGSKYIVIPNPMYGYWTGPATAGSTAETTKEKMKESLRGY